MNWEQIEANWKQTKGRFQEKWGKLTGSDLDQAAGARDRLVGLVQERYAIAKDKAEKQLDEFIQSLESSEAGEQSESQRPS